MAFATSRGAGAGFRDAFMLMAAQVIVAIGISLKLPVAASQAVAGRPESIGA